MLHHSNKMNNSRPWKSLNKRLSGESQFKFLIQGYCENIQEDAELKMVFKRIETKRLAKLMANLLQMGFVYSSHDSMIDDDVRSRIILKNYTLFQLELDSDQLKNCQISLNPNCTIPGWKEMSLSNAWNASLICVPSLMKEA
ncbi:unnamed protein product [Cylindrotheca closterium]|uniref:Uncharacterized protein n=1 Tax=Cylindrotheca closterium TaxID=2856 RepID=A0AAD2CC64_9STRA|nr:unnamed protein product [Cylindrotheca closterium]